MGAGLPAIASDPSLPASRASPLPQAACAAMTTLTAAEVWMGAGLPAIASDPSLPASRASPLPQAACTAMATLTAAEVWVGAGLPAIASGPSLPAPRASPTSCLRSHTYIDGYRGLGGSWLASDRASSFTSRLTGHHLILLAMCRIYHRYRGQARTEDGAGLSASLFRYQAH